MLKTSIFQKSKNFFIHFTKQSTFFLIFTKSRNLQKNFIFSQNRNSPKKKNSRTLRKDKLQLKFSYNRNSSTLSKKNLKHLLYLPKFLLATFKYFYIYQKHKPFKKMVKQTFRKKHQLLFICEAVLFFHTL